MWDGLLDGRLPPPEQARGEPATHASDIYGLGVVAYELLTGGRPFEGGLSTEEAAAHIHQPRPAGVGARSWPATLVDRVFDRALAKDGAQRYGSAGEFVEDPRASLEPKEPTRIRTAPLPYPPPCSAWANRSACRAWSLRWRRCGGVAS